MQQLDIIGEDKWHKPKAIRWVDLPQIVRTGWQCYELSAPMITGHQSHKTCVPEVTQRAFIIPACAKTRHCDFFQMAHVKMTENVSECLFCPTK